MTNFNELVEKATNVADARTKAYSELKRSAPDYFKKYAEAMKSLGYKDSIFYGKLFHNQATFAEEPYGEMTGASLRLDFDTMRLTESTDEQQNPRTGKMEDIFDGEAYELDFTKNTYGKKLLEFLKTIPKRMEDCIKAAENEIASVNGFLTEKE